MSGDNCWSLFLSYCLLAPGSVFCLTAIVIEPELDGNGNFVFIPCVVYLKGLREDFWTFVKLRGERSSKTVENRTFRVPDQDENFENAIRLMLVGRTGHGKSSTANSLFGQKLFEERDINLSVRMPSCRKKIVRDGCLIDIVDTPGFFDTTFDWDYIQRELRRALVMSTPGFHAIGFILQKGRFTPEMQDTVELFFNFFGQDVEHHALIIFTHVDNQRELKRYLEVDRDNPYNSDEEENEHDWVIDGSVMSAIRKYGTHIEPTLRKLIDRCEGRMAIINNKTKNKRQKRIQVAAIHSQIEKIKGSTHGEHFSNDNYKILEDRISVETDEIMAHPDRNHNILERCADSGTKQKMKLEERWTEQLENIRSEAGPGATELKEKLKHIVRRIDKKDANNENAGMLSKTSKRGRTHFTINAGLESNFVGETPKTEHKTSPSVGSSSKAFLNNDRKESKNALDNSLIKRHKDTSPLQQYPTNQPTRYSRGPISPGIQYETNTLNNPPVPSVAAPTYNSPYTSRFTPGNDAIHQSYHSLHDVSNHAVENPTMTRNSSFTQSLPDPGQGNTGNQSIREPNTTRLDSRGYPVSMSPSHSQPYVSDRSYMTDSSSITPPQPTVREAEQIPQEPATVPRSVVNHQVRETIIDAAATNDGFLKNIWNSIKEGADWFWGKVTGFFGY